MIGIPARKENVRVVVLTIGLPGSGKSTWAKKLVESDRDRWKRINRDDLRLMLHGRLHSGVLAEEQAVWVAINNLLKAFLKQGYDVVVDNTNLKARDRKVLHKVAANAVDEVNIVETCFHVPLEIVKKQNASREPEKIVPEEVIDNMAMKAKIDPRSGKITSIQETITNYSKQHATIIQQDESLPAAIICDLDGTLAKIGDRSPYDASNCDVVDVPNTPVIDCVLAMEATGSKIVFLSGRSEKDREPTERFIKTHCPVPYELYMRPANDSRKDSIVKEELFVGNVKNRYNVRFVLDDRDQVVELWRSLGLTCFQVDEGDF